MSYVYQIEHKFKRNMDVLRKYGFEKYVDEDGEEIIYAKRIVLPIESSIVTHLKTVFERIYKSANEEEKKEFEDYSFTKNGKLKLTKNVKKEFSECQLCVSVNSDVGKYTLFINAPDKIEYYSVDVLDECVKDIIEQLKQEKIIYKKKAREPKKTVIL